MDEAHVHNSKANRGAGPENQQPTAMSSKKARSTNQANAASEPSQTHPSPASP